MVYNNDIDIIYIKSRVVGYKRYKKKKKQHKGPQKLFYFYFFKEPQKLAGRIPQYIFIYHYHFINYYLTHFFTIRKSAPLPLNISLSSIKV